MWASADVAVIGITLQIAGELLCVPAEYLETVITK